VIDDGELRHRRLVELQEGQVRRGRTPPVGTVVAAPVDLFLIHPVEAAVQALGAAIGREAALTAMVHVHDMQIVAAQKAHELPVRAERELVFFLGSRGQALRAVVRAERHVVEVVVDGHDGGRALGVHLEPATAEGPPDDGALEPERGGRPIAHGLRLEERRALAGGGLDLRPGYDAAVGLRP
jgi:hypothetical protein